jgi:hypothetical protein
MSTYEHILVYLRQIPAYLATDRTFPDHSLFTEHMGAGQQSLLNCMQAYSIVDTVVGYCQGLSFVGGLLLMHVSTACSSDHVISYIITMPALTCAAERGRRVLCAAAVHVLHANAPPVHARHDGPAGMPSVSPSHSFDVHPYFFPLLGLRCVHDKYYIS